MKTILATITALSAMACLPLFALQCAWCNQHMLDGDLYCCNCGKEKGSRPQALQRPVPTYSPAPAVRDYGSYQRYNEDSTFTGFGGHLLGTGRGLVTASLSPLNVVRGMGTGCAWTESVGVHKAGGEAVLYCSLFFISVGTVMGTFSTCADVINGALDTVSFGCYGNWLYDSKESGRPTPWIWERKWYDNGIPWVDRK